MQQLSPWVSVCLEQQALFHQKGLQLHLVYNYAAYARVHVLTLHTEGTPLLLFCDPAAVPKLTPWDLCAKGDLGSMESNVMAGRALFALFTVEQKGQRCAIFLLMGKHMQGNNKSAAARAYRRISPKELELLLPFSMASAFCDRLLNYHLRSATYFDPKHDWPQPIATQDSLTIALHQLALLGDTRSRRELLVFAEANPARLPLAMGITQVGIPVRRMVREKK